MSQTKNTRSVIAQSLFDHYPRRQRRVMTFPDEQQRAAYRQNRGSDYLIARGANPLTGLITPSVDLSADEYSMDSRAPSPTRNSNPYPDLRPKRSRFSRAFDKPESPPHLRPPRDDTFEALPLVVDQQPAEESAVVGGQQEDALPLRGSGRRIQAAPGRPPSIKPEDHLCCMNVPRTIQKSGRNVEETPDAPSQSPDTPRHPEGRSASLPLLATQLHMTPPASPQMHEERVSFFDEARYGSRAVPRRRPVPPPPAPPKPKEKRNSLIALFDKLPRIKLVHPSQAATPKSQRTDMPFAYKIQSKKKKGAEVELDGKHLLFWIFVGYPGMLIWELGQLLQQATSAKSLSSLQDLATKSELKVDGAAEAGLLIVKLIAAFFVCWYLFRVLTKVGETIIAILWPLELLWSLVKSVSRNASRR